MNKKLDKIVGHNFRQLRTSKSISQAELGRKLKVSQKTISNLEKNGEVSSATLSTIEELTDFFKIPAYLLLMDGINISNADDSIYNVVRGYLDLGEREKAKLLSYLADLIKLNSIDE